MSAISETKIQMIRYWEKRRIAYNLCVVPSALLGWFLGGVVPAGVGDEEKLGFFGITSLFLAFAIAANICYSGVYVFEFLFRSDSHDGFWTKRGRALIFVFGCLFAIGLAHIGGIQIAALEYSWRR